MRGGEEKKRAEAPGPGPGFHMPGAALTARGQRTHRSAPAHLLLAGCSPCARMRPIPHVSRYITHTRNAPITNQLAANQSHALAPRAFAPCPPTPPIHPQPTAAGRRDRSGQHQGNGTGGRRRCRVPPLAPITPRPILESARRLAGCRADTPTRARTHAGTHARRRAHAMRTSRRTHAHTSTRARRVVGKWNGWWLCLRGRTHAARTQVPVGGG